MTLRDLGIEVKSSNQYKSICPKCSHERKHKHDPCLSVHREDDHNAWWRCHHCGWKGNLKQYFDDSEIIKKTKYKRDETPIYSEQTLDFLKSKGLTQLTTQVLRWWETKTTDGIVLNIPHFYNGSLVQVKSRPLYESDRRFWQQVGGKAVLVGMDDYDEDILDKNGRTYFCICEGETDMATLRQIGINNSGSVPDGAPSPKSDEFHKKFQWLDDPQTKKFLNSVDIVYLAGDNDDAGNKFNEEVSKRIGKERCRKLVVPADCKDINETFLKYGRDKLISMFNEAELFPIKGIIKLENIKSRVKDYTKNVDHGIRTGITKIDELIRIRKGKGLTIVVTGIPKMGKSSVVRWLITEWSRFNDIKWGLFTPENSPAEREYAMLSQVYMKKIFEEGFATSMSDYDRDVALEWVSKHFYIIEPDLANFEESMGMTNENYNTLESLFKYISLLSRQEGISGYVLDAWNKVEHQTSKYDTNFISRELDKIINFNRYWGLTGIIVAHPTKMPRLPSGNYVKPGLYNIDGSAAWNNKPDFGVVVHRDKFKFVGKNDEGERVYELDYEAPTQFIVEAVRFRELGKEGRVDLFMEEYEGFRQDVENFNHKIVTNSYIEPLNKNELDDDLFL